MNSGSPYQEAIRVFLLSVPLIVGGVIHMIVVKADVLSYLKKPIHQRWFGHNKTWRGIFVMLLATFPGVILAQQLENVFELDAPLMKNFSSIVLAITLGMGYCLAELPNSFLKRRLGIREGLTSERYKWFFVIGDQADSAIGCIIAYRLFLDISPSTILLTIIFGTVIHLLINRGLYALGLRKNPY